MGLPYFLAYFSFTFFLVAGQTPKYVLKGKGDHLKPDIPGQPNSILWKHNGNKIVEFDGSEEQVYDPYRNRITLNWITAELEITDLRYEDSGDYELEVDINNKVYSSESKLEVIDKVATPTISCKLNEGSSTDGSEVKATLLCSAEPRQPESLMKFEWRSQGKLHPGSKLPISLGDTQIDEDYICTVSNPVSSEKATFRAKDCYHENNFSVALGVGLFLAVLLLGALVGTVLFFKWKQKACFAKGQQDDVENQSPAKEPTGENRPLLRKKPNRAETLASHQPLGHLPQNHETSPDKLTAGQKEADVGGVISKGSVKKMARGFDNLAAKNGQTPPEKSQDSESTKGEHIEAEPSLQQNQCLHTSDSEGDQEEDQAKESTEAEVQPSDLSGSETENQLNLAGGKEHENTASDQIPMPEQPEADVSRKKEGHGKEELNSEQATPEKSQDLKGNAGEQDTVTPLSSPPGKTTSSKDQSNTEEENRPNQTDLPEEIPELEQPDVISTAQQQDPESTKGGHKDAESSHQHNQSRHTSDSEGDQEEQANNSTEAKTQPSVLSGSEQGNPQNPAGGTGSEDTAPDQIPTPEQPEADVSRKKEGHGKEELNSEQATPEKSQDLKGNAGEQDTVTPLSSPPGKTTSSKDQSNTEEENRPNQTDLPEEIPELAQPDVISTAQQQDPESTKGGHKDAESSHQHNQSRHTSDSEGDQEEQANNSTEAKTQPSVLSGSEQGNPQNPAGGTGSEDTAPDQIPTPEQPEADVSRKREGHGKEELNSEQATPEKSQDLKGNAGEQDTVTPLSSPPGKTTSPTINQTQRRKTDQTKLTYLRKYLSLHSLM
ncbi:serine/arginine repetitive matrix protein 2-like [Cheilinus undulatus]|uniref:serine/arginine repetitive matrix protein 2-like n=1 Tax=Cheilinus undulatus TaxID=241271 RepID=UPI001BD3DC84|nr:serine/arginine repetitive matrix protein 2-like [Cheilinus undulatus]